MKRFPAICEHGDEEHDLCDECQAEQEAAFSSSPRADCWATVWRCPDCGEIPINDRRERCGVRPVKLPND